MDTIHSLNGLFVALVTLVALVALDHASLASGADSRPGIPDDQRR